MKALKVAFLPEDEDVFRELEKDAGAMKRLEQAAAIGLQDQPEAATSVGDGLTRIRTREEEERREGEVQELLNRPRVMPEQSGIRRRQLSTDVSHDAGVANTYTTDQPRDDDRKSKEISSPIQEMLRKGFGQVRRSLDVG